MGFIYQILNIKSNKCYIGQSRQTNPTCRWSQHRHQAFTKLSTHSALYDAMRSYGIDFFKFNVLLTEVDNDDLNRKEEEYIKIFNSIVPNGYNIRAGGNHTPHSEETRRKIGEKSKGRKATLGQKRTEEQKRNIGNASRGRKFSEAVKEHLKMVHNDWHKANPIAHKNCKFSQDDIRYIRKNPDKLTLKEVSVIFKVKPYVIQRIIDKKSYKYVPD